MIAVFSSCERDFREMKFTPKEMFVRIRSMEDICGRKFTGIIETYHWWHLSKKIKEAFEAINQRQPELFK